MEKVSIGVVTYNSSDKVCDLLRSIIQFTMKVTYQIYVIDNNSTDNTVELIKESFPSVKILPLSKNVGFGEGHNQILNIIDSQYHVIINPDITFFSDVISSLAHYLDDMQNAVMVTPRIINLDGTEQFLPKKKPTFRYLLAGRLGNCIGYFSRLRSEYTMQNEEIREPIDIDFSTGCLSMIRTEIFKKINGFDDRFFMYLEDADLTLRAKAYGRAIFNPEISAVHVWERSSAKKIKFFLIHSASMMKFFWKWRSFF